MIAICLAHFFFRASRNKATQILLINETQYDVVEEKAFRVKKT